MEIIEQNLIAKSSSKKNEDGLVITDDFIAVIDGSTSKTEHRYCFWLSNGCYAMKIISRYIKKMPADISCRQFCAGVTRAIRKHYNKKYLQLCAFHPEERLTASAIIFSRLRREIWFVGDCQCLIDGEHYETPKPYEQPLAEMRAERVRQLLSEGKTANDILACDEARAAVIPRMLQEMKNQNVTYAVIDGFYVPEHLVPVITLDFRPHEIVLASDGYPFLCSTLEKSEASLRLQRETDPLNIGVFKATKGFTPGNLSFDDRTYVRFTV